MTNGEKIKELFPSFDVEDKTEYFGRVRNLDDHFIKADIEWWNAEYQEPTTKNNLGVDCISRADARSLICKIDRKYMFGMSGKAFQDLYKGIDDLPSVTPTLKEDNEKMADLLKNQLTIISVQEKEINNLKTVFDKMRAEIEFEIDHRIHYVQ